MMQRLDQIKALLNYENVRELHYKSNLMRSLETFAGLTKDAELEKQCEEELEKIKSAINAMRN